jgi:hypothetical protein
MLGTFYFQTFLVLIKVLGLDVRCLRLKEVGALDLRLLDVPFLDDPGLEFTSSVEQVPCKDGPCKNILGNTFSTGCSFSRHFVDWIFP